jgi:hypothetical protein
MLISSEIGVPFLKRWIYHHTEGMRGVVELGAGYFGKLALLHPDVRWRAGIEIFPACHAAPEFSDCQRIQADMREYRGHVDLSQFPCAMLIDSLEHIDKQDGESLIRRCQADFRRIILMLPEG